MKKLKKQLLLTLYLYGNGEHVHPSFCTYKILYQLLPFASSSIRGEVSEFVANGVLLQTELASEKGFALSNYGKKLAGDLFWPLLEQKEPKGQTVTMFVFDSLAKLQEKRACEAFLNALGAKRLRLGTWILARSLETGERPKLTRFPFLWIAEQAILTKHSDSTMQQFESMQRSLSRPIKKQLSQLHDMIAANVPRPKFALKSYQELISAFTALASDNSRTTDSTELGNRDNSTLFKEFSHLSSLLYTMPFLQ